MTRRLFGSRALEAASLRFYFRGGRPFQQPSRNLGRWRGYEAAQSAPLGSQRGVTVDRHELIAGRVFSIAHGVDDEAIADGLVRPERTANLRPIGWIGWISSRTNLCRSQLVHGTDP